MIRIDGYIIARTRKDVACFICKDIIYEGAVRYRRRSLSLCVKCAACWQSEGGRLGNISRHK